MNNTIQKYINIKNTRAHSYYTKIALNCDY